MDLVRNRHFDSWFWNVLLSWLIDLWYGLLCNNAKAAPQCHRWLRSAFPPLRNSASSPWDCTLGNKTCLSKVSKWTNVVMFTLIEYEGYAASWSKCMQSCIYFINIELMFEVLHLKHFNNVLFSVVCRRWDQHGRWTEFCIKCLSDDESKRLILLFWTCLIKYSVLGRNLAPISLQRFHVKK